MKSRTVFSHTLFGFLFGASFPIVSTIIWVIQNQLSFTPRNIGAAQIDNPLQWIIDCAPFIIGTFGYFLGVRQARLDKTITQLQEGLYERSQLVEKVETINNELENVVNRQLKHLKIVSDIAREAASIREMDTLLQTSVRLASERLGYYHAGLFLIDEPHEYAVLVAASSEGGQRMLARQHKLKLGREGIVGNVAATGKARVASDVGADEVFFNNPDLPATRSEASLPLIVKNVVIGVLDVQATDPAAFTEEIVSILQTLADQIALAIDNTRNLQKTNQALKELQQIYEHVSGTAWQNNLAGQKLVFSYNKYSPGTVKSASPPGTGELRSPKTIEVPIQFRGRKLGWIVLKKEDGRGRWSQEETEIIQKTAANVGLALENVVLLQDSQQRAQHEQMINEISTNMRQTLDLQSIIETALWNVGEKMDLSQVEIHLEQI